MEKEYYGFIYITTNNINGRKYIGKKNYDKNGYWKEYLGSGIALKNAINKYGKENFNKEILEICETKEELNEKEKYWIKKYNATDNDLFYNIASGGDGGNVTIGYTEEQLKIYYKNKSKGSKGIINQGKNNPRAKMVICLNNGMIFETTVLASAYGNTKDYCIQACCNGRSYTAGVDKNTKQRLQWKYYEEGRKYKYIPHKRNIETIFSKKIKCLESGKVYDSVKDGAKDIKVNSNCLSMHLHGKTKSCGKCHWIFI